jgi:hypothetical protein
MGLDFPPAFGAALASHRSSNTAVEYAPPVARLLSACLFQMRTISVLA